MAKHTLGAMASEPGSIHQAASRDPILKAKLKAGRIKAAADANAMEMWYRTGCNSVPLAGRNDYTSYIGYKPEVVDDGE